MPRGALSRFQSSQHNEQSQAEDEQQEQQPLLTGRVGEQTGQEPTENLMTVENLQAPNPYEPSTNNTTPLPRTHSFTKRLLHIHDGSPSENVSSPSHTIPPARSALPHTQQLGQSSVISSNIYNVDKKEDGAKPGLGPRPIGGTEKLGTFSGVFVPTCLNVLSILMFLRFGFILGQAGLLGMMGMLVVAYIINLITTFSLSAIASNGTVRGGGAYYLISRSLGPEFGGSIGVVFYLGFVFNTGLNAVGLIDCVKQNFGTISGNWYRALPEGPWLEYAWATIVLLLCTGICLAGSAIFARASTGLLVILLVATFSIPFSALVMSPWEDKIAGIQYTGMDWNTFKGNLLPKLTRGAAGSQLKGRETFQDLFGILFPATGGIFAGASMSGDLKTPSKSIPKGTLWGLLLTFVAYTLVILAMATTITRASFINNVNVIQDTNLSGIIVLSGEFASTFFSTLMGVIGSAKLLQALARDKLIPGFSIFGQGTKNGDEPVYAIFFTYVVAQITMLANINQIASFVTMTYLMTFLVMNLATFLLEVGSAPNFRPSFKIFSWETALAGTIVSGAAMFFVDGVYASVCVAVLVFIFLMIHYTTPPKSWGDVSQSLIYHQVRKYLLRLRQEHVKFWRPQILLLVNDPRRQWKLIQFCNSMKKGGLYILGHVIVSYDFEDSVPEARRQQAAWTKYIDFSKVKAFVSICISPGLEWGARNIILSTGLGGMRPNIAIMGFYNMDDLRRSNPLVDVPEMPTLNRLAEMSRLKAKQHKKKRRSRKGNNDPDPKAELPTDTMKSESAIGIVSYVKVLEDLLLRLQINVAVAKGFQDLEFPSHEDDSEKRYIDLWPIQMSAEIASEAADKSNVLTHNFDTYTLILQLGCILNTVPQWKKSFKLRVAVFVEYESDVEEERGRVVSLLENLRIEAEVLVFWLASGSLSSYEVIVNGQSPGVEIEHEVDECLKDQDWWEEIQTIRGKLGDPSPDKETELNGISNSSIVWPESSYKQQDPPMEVLKRFKGLRKLMKKSKRKQTMSGVSRLGVSLGMRTQNLHPAITGAHAGHLSPSESSSSESSSDSDEAAIGSSSEDDANSIVSAVSENDKSDYESASSTEAKSPTKLIARRRSHGDCVRGPLFSKRATGAMDLSTLAIVKKAPSSIQSDHEKSSVPSRPQTPSAGASSALTESIQKMLETSGASNISTTTTPLNAGMTPQKLEERFRALRQDSPKAAHSPAQTASPQPQSTPGSPVIRPTSTKKERPSLSNRPSMIRKSSQQNKFSSKPVPITTVSKEEGPGPSIMFQETPSPPRRGRLPSAYKTKDPNSATSTLNRTSNRPGLTSHHSDIAEESTDPTESTALLASSPKPPSPRSTSIPSRRPSISAYSTYSTAALPLSFNDLPSRAQHLILNELIRSQSIDTAVVFTTLPSPMQGTSKDEEKCVAYLSDLEVFTKGLPPVMLVHSNSLTVTMSL